MQGHYEKTSLFLNDTLLNASLPAAPTSRGVSTQSIIAEEVGTSRQKMNDVKNREQIVHILDTIQWLVVISYQQKEAMVYQRRTN